MGLLEDILGQVPQANQGVLADRTEAVAGDVISVDAAVFNAATGVVIVDNHFPSCC